ncbi:hypothetical protein [Paeniglutamicibacter kerguelensis]|uniref:Uncharacterized protein n=1 Tax=Paeniglutamicibacter kerguelensis TaxID=254788 RepID=A0ABS4XCN4_9MICC|nr:hypothetical protein [Paeniglutamicibacter kerguelensis]MBP2386240.1 hypothetical protein [Paeniglutamicibacter kerguelensis]
MEATTEDEQWFVSLHDAGNIAGIAAHDSATRRPQLREDVGLSERPRATRSVAVAKKCGP